MSATQQLDITLPNELAEFVQGKIRTGEYSSESEVIFDGLHTLLDRDRAVEDWLRDEVVPAYDAIDADPSRGRSGDEVLASLRARHQARIAGR